VVILRQQQHRTKYFWRKKLPCGVGSLIVDMFDFSPKEEMRRLQEEMNQIRSEIKECQRQFDVKLQQWQEQIRTVFDEGFRRMKQLIQEFRLCVAVKFRDAKLLSDISQKLTKRIRALRKTEKSTTVKNSKEVATFQKKRQRATRGRRCFSR
jgi:hypothetical protein